MQRPERGRPASAQEVGLQGVAAPQHLLSGSVSAPAPVLAPALAPSIHGALLLRERGAVAEHDGEARAAAEQEAAQ